MDLFHSIKSYSYSFKQNEGSKICIFYENSKNSHLRVQKIAEMRNSSLKNFLEK